VPERGQQNEGSNPFADLSARLRFRAAAACVLDVAPIQIGEACQLGFGGGDRLFAGAGERLHRGPRRLGRVVGWGPGPDEVNADRRDLVGADGKVVRR
jgi:hypothetical protein